MSAKPIRMYSGPESVAAADAYRLAVTDRRNEWPYVHVYPPPNAIDVHEIGTTPTLAFGAGAAVVLTYKVNAGKRFFLRAVVLGANVAIIPGQALFTIDRNSPVGVADAQFMPEHGFVNVPIQLGNFNSSGPWKLQRAREFAPLDTIRIKGTNVGLAVGDPTYYVCGLFGYEVPTLDVKANR